MKATRDSERARRAEKALRGLERLHRYITAPDTDEDAYEPSAADQCEVLYELLESLGMRVP